MAIQRGFVICNDAHLPFRRWLKSTETTGRGSPPMPPLIKVGDVKYWWGSDPMNAHVWETRQLAVDFIILVDDQLYWWDILVIESVFIKK